MKANVALLESEPIPAEYADLPNVRIFQVLDYSLFMYALVREDFVYVSMEGKPQYHELRAWELNGVYRIGIPQFETSHTLTTLGGIFTPSKVEFSVDPADKDKLVDLGHIVGCSKWR